MLFFRVSTSQVNRATLPRSSSYLRSLTKCWRKDKEKPPGETHSVHGIDSLLRMNETELFSIELFLLLQSLLSGHNITNAGWLMLGDRQNLVIFFRAQREVYLGALWNTTWWSKPTKYNHQKLQRKDKEFMYSRGPLSATGDSPHCSILYILYSSQFINRGSSKNALKLQQWFHLNRWSGSLVKTSLGNPLQLFVK